MTAEQFKNMCWRDLGRLPAPNQNPGEHASVSVSWRQSGQDDLIAVEVKWMPKGWQLRKNPKFHVAAVCTILKNIPEGASLESVVHTLSDDLRGQIEVKNSLDYSDQ